ncbi:hypothetical protein BDZ89DRAFT_1073673 [Hymenopellis radicata]|nr:hypothetical protein BDZ89DRAFT_1073673 [Hymenopellis radicata]
MSLTLKDRTSQPIAGVVFPSSPTITAALAYMDSHSTPVVANHVMRSAYFALIIGPKLPLDGANAARDFLRTQDPSFSDADLQLVWDAIALHSSFSIAVHKEPLVGLACIGITTDFLGPNNAEVLKLGREVLTPDEWRAVETVFPYLNMEEGIRQVFCGLCLSKPDTTYDNTAGQFGVKYLPGYSLEGKQAIDLIENGLKGLEEFRNPA